MSAKNNKYMLFLFENAYLALFARCCQKMILSLLFSLLKQPQQLGLDQANSRSLAHHPGLPHACRDPGMWLNLVCFPHTAAESWMASSRKQPFHTAAWPATHNASPTKSCHGQILFPFLYLLYSSASHSLFWVVFLFSFPYY